MDYQMLHTERSDIESSYVQKLALSAYYPGHNVRIIGARGNDAVYELYEGDDEVENLDWFLPILEEIEKDKDLLNDQGHPNGIIIAEFKLAYTEDETDEPELMEGWSVRRPTEEELVELADGSFTKAEL